MYLYQVLTAKQTSKLQLNFSIKLSIMSSIKTIFPNFLNKSSTWFLDHQPNFTFIKDYQNSCKVIKTLQYMPEYNTI